jgi:hypothetical protein
VTANVSRRRFLLLPEEALDDDERRPRIRRYRLTSVGLRGSTAVARSEPPPGARGPALPGRA